MRYCYDLHVHTSNASKCARSTGREMARAYAEAGYSGLVITDHFFNGYTCIDSSLPWKERVARFCSGYEEASDEGQRMGLDVFFGWEYCLNGTEFLTYGLDKQWLMEHDEVLEIPVQEYFALVHACGGFISHAHPFRKRDDIPPVQLFPEYMDAVEVYNGGNSKQTFNEEAKAYADQHGLLYTAGSDSHSAQALKGGGCAFPQRVKTERELIAALRRKPTVFKGSPLVRGEKK